MKGPGAQARKGMISWAFVAWMKKAKRVRMAFVWNFTYLP